jgi:hypothetical protein
MIPKIDPGSCTCSNASPHMLMICEVGGACGGKDDARIVCQGGSPNWAGQGGKSRVGGCGAGWSNDQEGAHPQKGQQQGQESSDDERGAKQVTGHDGNLLSTHESLEEQRAPPLAGLPGDNDPLEGAVMHAVVQITPKSQEPHYKYQDIAHAIHGTADKSLCGVRSCGVMIGLKDLESDGNLTQHGVSGLSADRSRWSEGINESETKQFSLHECFPLILALTTIPHTASLSSY